MKAREEKEQLNQRIKLFEVQVKRNKAPQDLNTREHTEKVISIFFFYIYFIFNDIIIYFFSQLQHFYGKFLRADSRRKALAYQKRYLLSIVGGYQLSEENTLSVLAQLTKVQRSYAVIGRNKKSPKVRFRSAVLVVISICRMKWLIVRWNTGKRIGVKTLLWNIDQSFLPIQKTTINHSPPVRDKNTSK